VVIRRPPVGGAVAPRLLAIGSSTGGPSALSTVLRGLGAEFRLPILITQHMPPPFTAILAEHLAKDGRRPAQEGRQGEAIRPGEIYVAPGDRHMVVKKAGERAVIQVNQDRPENFCRPSVDPMFRSIAAVYGAATIAVVLTGMGEDGLAGGKLLAGAGAPVIAQDESTSVVWGMPGAIARAGIASAVLPLGAIADHVMRLARERRDAA
jgi:two-component system chemotaxis response regulator CheB